MNRPSEYSRKVNLIGKLRIQPNFPYVQYESNYRTCQFFCSPLIPNFMYSVHRYAVAPSCQCWSVTNLRISGANYVEVDSSSVIKTICIFCNLLLMRVAPVWVPHCPHYWTKSSLKSVFFSRKPLWPEGRVISCPLTRALASPLRHCFTE